MKILDDQELNNLNAVFTEKERLLIHQLRLLEWLSTRYDGKTTVVADAASVTVQVPQLWQLTKDITLYPWQELCIKRWLEANCKGTVKVVTGGGKTLLALALAEELQNTSAPELCVAIVVPTIVLMHQWYEELLDRGNIPPEAIGRLGGGYKDDFSEGRRILISVLATACKELPKIVEQSNVGDKLLLVADECHRFGAKEMSQIFATKRAYSLGLSATPERDDEADDSATSFDESLLGKELGAIIYDFTLKEALELGIVPSFSIHHYGLSLLPEERHKYDRLSRSISEAQSELKNSMGKSSNVNFFQWVRGTAQRGGPLQHRAIQFIGDTSRRKELVYGMASRITAVEELIRSEFLVNPDARVILFHESINEVMRIFLHLKNSGFPVIAEHSELPNTMREAGLELFRKGTAQIIVSAKSLIEGFNVPAVDVGIIVASSSSVRQRIQSLGRVLRKHRSSSGEEKTSCIHVLYAANTVDDAIYGREDWERFTGVDRNYYYLWPEEQNPIPQEGPPRLPLPDDSTIDLKDLTVGGIYPGQYEGEEFSVDTRGNITDASEQHVVNASPLAPLILKVKGCAGRFRVTPRKRYVLVYLPEGVAWVVKFVAQLEVPFQFELAANSNDVSEEVVQQWLATAHPGDLYPFAGHFEKVDEFGFSQRRGGLITKKIRGGELYARGAGDAENSVKGDNAQTLLSVLKRMHREGHNLSKLEVNYVGHVLFREKGRLMFLTSIPEGIEFPRI